MTDKQKAFVQALVSDPEFNGTRAYMKVYKRCKNPASAATSASRLLKNVEIRAYKEELLKRVEDEGVAGALEIQMRLTNILRGQVDTVIPVYVDKGVQELKKVGTPVGDMVRAAHLLGKAKGMYIDKNQQIEGPPVIVDDVE